MQSRLVMESPASKQLKTHVLWTENDSIMPDEEPFGSDLASIQVVLHAALPHQKQWRHQKPLTICTYTGLKIPLG
ncbi:hypothetical protein EMCRGX_G030149 [Ephydatia muelleri]